MTRYFVLTYLFILPMICFPQDKKPEPTKEPVVFRIRPRQQQIQQNSFSFSQTRMLTLSQHFQTTRLKRVIGENEKDIVSDCLNFSIVKCKITVYLNGKTKRYEGGYATTYHTYHLPIGTKVVFENITLQDTIGNKLNIKKMTCVVK